MESSEVLSETIDKKHPKDNEYPFISIIIPAFNESEHIERTIQSLRDCNYPKECYEVIVVDNGSSDNTYEISLNAADKSLKLEEGNVGAVRNFGAQNSKGDILAFIDADCVVGSNWLLNIKNITKEKTNSIFGGTCTLPNEKNWIEKYWLLGGANKRQRDLVGASIAIERTLFFSLGGFNEDVTSGEDTELSNRARSLKVNIEITPRLSVIHMGNAKTVLNFLKRQIWHSENYFLNLEESIKDPTFILCIFSLCLLAAAGFYSIYNPTHAIIPLIIFLLIVLTFSFKRMIYAKFYPRSIFDFFKIYFLDFLYVIARVYGLLRSIYIATTNQK